MNRTRLREILSQDEGRRYTPYTDTLGNLTIGVGHLMSRPVKPDAYLLATGREVTVDTLLPSDVGPISEAAVNAILDDDIDVAHTDAVIFVTKDYSPSEWHRLSAVRQEVLVNMSFNLGSNKLKTFVKFRAALRRGDWNKAADEMLDSLWARQVGNRANRLAAAMRSNNPRDLYQQRVGVENSA